MPTSWTYLAGLTFTRCGLSPLDPTTTADACLVNSCHPRRLSLWTVSKSGSSNKSWTLKFSAASFNIPSNGRATTIRPGILGGMLTRPLSTSSTLISLALTPSSLS